jgi:hypothetical protein
VNHCHWTSGKKKEKLALWFTGNSSMEFTVHYRNIPQPFNVAMFSDLKTGYGIYDLVISISDLQD